MRLKALAPLFTGWLLLGTSSCSGKSSSAEFTEGGGTDSGGKGGAAHAGSTATGGSSAGKAGSPVGGSSSSGGTSNHDQPNCDTDFDVLDKSCTKADDCVLVQHQVDCCGTILIMGLASSEQAGFAALEQYCAAQFPLCGCAAQGMKLEDGSLIDFGANAAVVECSDGRCQSRNSGVTTPCGNQTCTASQYCREFVGGPAGSQPSYNCLPLGDCQDCACLNEVACQCSKTGNAIKVFCAAP